MGTNKPSDPYEAAVASLRAKETRLVAELDAVRKSLAAIDAAREAADWLGSQLELTGDPFRNLPPDPVVSDKFRGLGLEQAATKILSESDRLELTGKQIWSALSAAGYSLLSDRPEQSVSWALRKRERKVGDVILVGDGKWGMVSWYSQARLKELRNSRNNASTRNSAEHIEKTKAGIANAKRNRLQHWGRKRTITGEQMAAAYYAIQSGVKSKLQAAKAADMAWPTFNFYWCQYEMESWKPGDAFPPRKRDIEKKASDFKLEDMWPRKDNLFAQVHVNGNGPQH